ncbi:MAG: TrkH family potassium uptake protein [Bacilli bacterium]|nr:TrkH family potassium uptake protein [Bacilli bacterium]
MFKKSIWKYIGKVLIGLSILFIFPILVALIYHESVLPFFIASFISLILGLLLNELKVEDAKLYTRDGLLIVALSWIVMSIIGTIPFCLSGSCGFVDALFETVSGFTTTGASIFNDVEHLSKSILFFRSFTHFIGGMGILTFVMAVIPLSKKDNSMHILKAEMPGPSVSKLVPSTKKTLIYLYSIYIGLTVAEMILLLIGGMPLFDSILISMGTAGTGGFSVLNSSLATYSVFCKYVVAIFMFLFGVNFYIYFLILMKDFKNVFKSEELSVYIGLFICSVLFVFFNTVSMFANASEAFLEAFFHVSSVMTSTGYGIGDINIYPTTCRVLFLALMLISACAGSTCGGFKISRIIIVFKTIKRNIQRIIYPSRVKMVSFEGKKLDEDIINNTGSFMYLYFITLFLIIFIICFDGVSISTAINAAFTTFGNVGMCFEISSFGDFSNLSKIVMSIGMLLGRLEIFPIIVLFSRNYK